MTTICFSATASLGAGIALLAIGAATMRRARVQVELPYAAIPIIFGVQQLTEGGLWLALPTHHPATHALTILYLLFSNVLWPLYVPLAVWLIEPEPARRRWFIPSILAGAGTSLFFLIAIASQPVAATISGPHIDYLLPHPHQTIAFAFYALATCLAPLLSSYRMVRLLGIILIGSMIMAYLVYAMWFASVWCFFAALTSSIVFLHFARRDAPRAASSIRPA